jgi:hypothetical protein
MVDEARSGETDPQQYKELLIKTARMYAMCQKAEVQNPWEVTGLALAAFQEMPLKQALVFVQSNEQNVKDLAWAFKNSGSAEEFEQRLKEIKRSPAQEDTPQRNKDLGK